MTDRGIRLADTKRAAIPVRLSSLAPSYSIGRSWRRGRTVANETVFRNGRCGFSIEKIQISHHQSKKRGVRVCVCFGGGQKTIIHYYSPLPKDALENYMYSRWGMGSDEKGGPLLSLVAFFIISLFYSLDMVASCDSQSPPGHLERRMYISFIPADKASCDAVVHHPPIRNSSDALLACSEPPHTPRPQEIIHQENPPPTKNIAENHKHNRSKKPGGENLEIDLAPPPPPVAPKNKKNQSGY